MAKQFTWGEAVDYTLRTVIRGAMATVERPI